MREWLVFLPIAFFIIFPLFSFFSSGAELSELREFSRVSWPIIQGGLLFIYALLNGQLASSSIAREGSSVWILRTLPLSGGHITLGKLWISWLLPFLLLTIIECIIGIFLGWTIGQFAIGIVMKAVITVGISAIGLWLGTIGAKYNPTNPQARLKSGTSIILLVLSYVYMFFSFIPYVLLIVPPDAIDFLTEISNDTSGFIGTVAGIVTALLSWKASYPIIMGIIGVVFMFLFSLGIAAILILASVKRIDRGIKIHFVQESTAKALFKNSRGGL